MDLIKDCRSPDRKRSLRVASVPMSLAVALFATGGIAETCLPPLRPYFPDNPRAARVYAEIVRRDFDFYVRDIEAYFRCLERVGSRI